MYNTLYMQYLPGNLRFPFHAKFVGRSGFEREVGALWRQIAMDGYPGSAALGNPDGIEKYSMLVVKTPFDLAGTGAGKGNRTRFISVATQQAVDDRREHSTVIEDASPRNIWNYYADLDVNDFSLAGFQKFNK